LCAELLACALMSKVTPTAWVRQVLGDKCMHAHVLCVPWAWLCVRCSNAAVSPFVSCCHRVCGVQQKAGVLRALSPSVCLRLPCVAMPWRLVVSRPLLCCLFACYDPLWLACLRCCVAVQPCRKQHSRPVACEPLVVRLHLH
jgi:hypothetical protein